MPPPAAARRAKRMNSPTSSSVGPNPSRISASKEVRCDVDWAFTWTPCERSSEVRSLLFQKVGTSVENSVVGVALVSLGG
jgi:hypothetical protein